MPLEWAAPHIVLLVLFSVSCKISYTKSFMGWVCRYMHCARTYIECITYPNISTIHSYISTPAQHATRPSVLVCVMIYAGGKNNVIPHTTGLTTRLSSSCVSITFHLYYKRSGCLRWLGWPYGSAITLALLIMVSHTSIFPGHIFRGHPIADETKTKISNSTHSVYICWQKEITFKTFK